ncbi:MAG: hypothetical protein AAF547_22605 [Actinomycetota bacterium]
MADAPLQLFRDTEPASGSEDTSNCADTDRPSSDGPDTDDPRIDGPQIDGAGIDSLRIDGAGSDGAGIDGVDITSAHPSGGRAGMVPSTAAPAADGRVVLALAPPLPDQPAPDSDPTPVTTVHGPVPASDHLGRAVPTVADGVVALNEAAAVFDALARGIQGTAVGWPAAAIEKLEAALLHRYGPLIGGPTAVDRLVALAKHPGAA